ncbi:MAG: multidrug efflux SMR transporter [Lysobacterales bacterium]|jgi:small multidrug resistance pump
MGYVYLSIAVVVEVIATMALKSSEGFTRLVPSVLVVVGYGTAFYLLTLVLKTIPVGITYAVWAGLGIALVTIAAAVVFGEIPDMPAIVGIALIMTGVVVINLFSRMQVQ